MKTYILLLIVAVCVLPSFAQNFRELDEHGYLLRDGFNRRPHAVQTILNGTVTRNGSFLDGDAASIIVGQSFALYHSPVEMSYAIHSYGGFNNNETWRFGLELGLAFQALKSADGKYGFAPRIAGRLGDVQNLLGSHDSYYQDGDESAAMLVLPLTVRWNDRFTTTVNTGLIYDQYYPRPDCGSCLHMWNERLRYTSGLGLYYAVVSRSAILLEATHTILYDKYFNWQESDRFRDPSYHTLVSPGLRYAIPTGNLGYWVVGAGVPFSVGSDEDLSGVYFSLSINTPGLQ